MQRSSPSIAAPAAALAKAQIELANPEKSLIGTIEPQGGQGGARQFRYAPLSSGLEIVRKTLGQHEIATVQTTAIDDASGIVNLTTTLAHSSGEWIASDWPVCSVAETATPHRMGAALTYARRYALFTLVGIAGEDDLDAPDLITPTTPAPKEGRPAGNSRHNGDQKDSDQRLSINRHQRANSSASKILKHQLSASLREQLLGQLLSISSPDEAANWAHRVLGAKNTLTRNDAERVEQAFQAKLGAFANDTVDRAVIARDAPSRPRYQRKRQQRSTAVDKNVLALPAPRRMRDRDHVKSVAQQPCLICGRRPADAHHLRFAQSRALGRKVSDEFTVPLCRGHHREVHHCADEAAWWEKIGIDPTVTARALWLKTHPLPAIPGETSVERSTYAVLENRDL